MNPDDTNFGRVAVRSIARPLLEELATAPFSGFVWGRFKRACNLTDDHHRVITLASAPIGNGPFSIVIEANPGFFRTLNDKQPARATPHFVKIGRWTVELAGAEIWEPKLSWPEEPFVPSAAVRTVLTPYQDWPHLEKNAPVATKMRDVACQAADSLQHALRHQQPVAEAAARLAGLGAGLTPAGDDYLVGVMAALWLAGRRDLPPQIAQAAAPQTTTLSAAFLIAAAKGEFIEPWHALAQAIRVGDEQRVKHTVSQVAQFGATSGTDALAGFAAAIQSITAEGP